MALLVYVLNLKTLHLLQENGYARCKHCNRDFEAGMTIVTKGRDRAPKYCDSCATLLNLV